MNSVALVFFTFWLHDPSVTTGPEFSERLFDTHSDCAEFVNTLADDGRGINVVDNNYEFKFASVDGLVFFGGCYTAEQYDEKFLDRS